MNEPIAVLVDVDPAKSAGSPGLAAALAEGRPVVASWMVQGSDGIQRVAVLLGPASPSLLVRAKGAATLVQIAGLATTAVGAIIVGSVLLIRMLGG